MIQEGQSRGTTRPLEIAQILHPPFIPSLLCHSSSIIPVKTLQEIGFRNLVPPFILFITKDDKVTSQFVSVYNVRKALNRSFQRRHIHFSTFYFLLSFPCLTPFWIHIKITETYYQIRSGVTPAFTLAFMLKDYRCSNISHVHERSLSSLQPLLPSLWGFLHFAACSSCFRGNSRCVTMLCFTGLWPLWTAAASLYLNAQSPLRIWTSTLRL
jgi:hypothetical protein